MKRFPTTPTRAPSQVLSTTRHVNNDFQGASLGDVLGNSRQAAAAPAQSSSSFRSKFMQQYENQTGQVYHPPSVGPPQQQQQAPPQPKPQDLADEAFMQTLRSAANPANTPGARRGSKPSWNDDVVSSSPYANGFGEPPAITKRREPVGGAKAGRDEPVPARRRSSGAGLTGGSSGVASNRAGEWNSDASYAPVDRDQDRNRERDQGRVPARRPGGGGGAGHPQPAQESPRLLAHAHDVSPRDRDRDRDRGEASGQGLGQARSRLSLLKLKMRQSESGGGSRASLGSEFGRSSPNLLDHIDNAAAPLTREPRTAPNGRSDEQHEAGSYLEEHRKKDRSKPPPSSSRSQHQSYLQQQEDEAERSAREYREEEAAYRQSLRDRDSDRTHQRDRERAREREREADADPYQRAGERDRANKDAGRAARPKPQQQLQSREREANSKPSKAVRSYEDDDEDQEETGAYTPGPYAPAGGASYGQPAPSEELDPYATGPVGEQKECPDCGRRFNPIPYARHVKICAKVFVNKRKVFDSKKMRIQDNPELVKILKQTAAKSKKAGREAPGRERPGGMGGAMAGMRGDPDAFGGGGGGKGGFGGGGMAGGMGGGGFGGGGFDAPPAAAKPRAAPSRAVSPPAATGATAKWKQDSNAFRDAMRAARQVSKAIATGAPLPPPTYSAPDPSMMQCPTCGRRFNQKAGERHIPQCANIMNKPRTLLSHSGKAAVSGGTPAKGRGGVRF